MIITENFVFIHLPKTGGTFAQSKIRSAYNGLSRWDRIRSRFGWISEEKLFLDDLFPNAVSPIGQHGRISDIPKKHGSKPVLSIIRDPFTWYLSLYEFKWWYKHPRVTEDYSYEDHPSYPELSFEEFYSNLAIVTSALLGDIQTSMDIGYYTLQFIHYYFRDPEAAFKRIDQQYIVSKRFRQDMFELEFIHTENLNLELYEYLQGKGFAQYRISNIVDAPKIFPQGKGKERHKLADYYTESIVQDILDKDMLIFEAFPEYRRDPLHKTI